METSMTHWIRMSGLAVGLLAALAGTSIAADPAAPAAAPAAPMSGATFELVTESEATTWNTVGPKEPADFKTRDLSQDNAAPTCHSTPDNDADNPKIKIVAPTIGKPLIAPIDIDLQFVQAGSTRVRPETFRVCYVGLITMDITKRITDRAAVSEQGLRVTGAQLPSGRHRLLLLIADERGRLARSEADINIL
jgi:hypothetical protein